MKKIALLFFIFLSINEMSQAQGYESFANGVAAKTQDFSDISGSAYSSEKWIKGQVKTANNKIYSDLDLRYSELEDKLFFKTAADEIKEFADKVTEFSFSDGKSAILYRNGYLNVPGWGANAYFEVLASGKVQLLKKVSKKIKEEVVYPSSTPSKSFQKATRYYLVTADRVYLVKNDKKSILAALGDKQPELDSYIKTNNLDLKSDLDLSELIVYYNSI